MKWSRDRSVSVWANIDTWNARYKGVKISVSQYTMPLGEPPYTIFFLQKGDDIFNSALYKGGRYPCTPEGLETAKSQAVRQVDAGYPKPREAKSV